MQAESDASPNFDLTAAGLRADGSDLRVSIEVLASKLEQALPGHTRVERQGGGLLHRGEKHLRSLRVELDGASFQLAVDGDRLDCARERQVGGVSIKRELLDPAAWVSALADALRVEATRSGQARQALERLLD
jgi:hypothetical protein